MPTKHEGIAQALLAALEAGCSAQVMREEELPVRCPAEGVLNLRPDDPQEDDQHLGTGVREWSRVFELEVVVQGAEEADRTTAFDALMVELGVIFDGLSLGGLVSHLELSAPEGVDEVPMEGAETLKGATVPVTAFYETTNNPMEMI